MWVATAKWVLCGGCGRGTSQGEPLANGRCPCTGAMWGPRGAPALGPCGEPRVTSKWIRERKGKRKRQRQRGWEANANRVASLTRPGTPNGVLRLGQDYLGVLSLWELGLSSIRGKSPPVVRACRREDSQSSRRLGPPMPSQLQEVCPVQKAVLQNSSWFSVPISLCSIFSWASTHHTAHPSWSGESENTKTVKSEVYLWMLYCSSVACKPACFYSHNQGMVQSPQGAPGIWFCASDVRRMHAGPPEAYF